MNTSLTRREIEILGYIAKGMSDREIEKILFLSLNTIKWHNRQIYNKLGVPNRRQAVAIASKNNILKLPIDLKELDTPKNNLPYSATSFIGRVHEIEKITSILQTARLVTLTGTGGVGKTRLSLQVANTIKESNLFKDGIYFIDLALIQNPLFIINFIIEVLRIPESTSKKPMEVLVNYLHNKEILLILDNFEHLLSEAEIVSNLLKKVPKIKILTTSRENLQLSGEYIFQVAPLDLIESVELFKQRAKAVKHDFEFDEPSLVAIEIISVRLDGLPLAIELAAARIVMISPQELLPQLENRLSMIKGSSRDAPERHLTLRATLDWSYDLLGEGEKMLFDRLGIFAGGCSLEAAQSVCGDKIYSDFFDYLEGLINKSLLSKEVNLKGEPRFVMLETLKEYALNNLYQSNELEKTHYQHAIYFASLSEKAEPALKNLDVGIELWTTRIEQDFENIRNAFNWSIESNPKLGIRIFNSLDGLWWYTHYSQQGNKWVDLVLGKISNESPLVQAKALSTSCMIAAKGDWDISRERGIEAINILRNIDELPTLAFVLGRLGVLDINNDRFSTANEFLLESLQLYSDLSMDRGSAYVLNAFGELMRIQKRFDKAKLYYEESIAMYQISGGEIGSAALYNLANVNRYLGDDESAYPLYIKTLDFTTKVNHTFLSCAAIFGIAGIIALRGNPILSAKLLGATEAILEESNHTIQPTDKADFEQSKKETRSLLNDKKFNSAWKKGKELSLTMAVSLVMQNDQKY